MTTKNALREFSDAELVECLKKKGSHREEAINWLHDKYYYRLMCFFINQYGLTKEDSDDQIQEIFIKLITKIDTFKGNSKLSTWVWSIAKNQALSLKNKASNRFSHSNFDELNGDFLEQPEYGKPSSYELNSFKNCVRDRLELFSQSQPKYAQVLKLVYFDEFSIADLATFTEKSYSATKEYLSQARKRAVVHVQPCYDDVRVK